MGAKQRGVDDKLLPRREMTLHQPSDQAREMSTIPLYSVGISKNSAQSGQKMQLGKSRSVDISGDDAMLLVTTMYHLHVGNVLLVY